VLVITGGIAAYFLNENSKSGPSNSLYGIGLLCLSLLMDSYTGPSQEKINHTYKPSVFAMMFWINFPPVLFNAVFLWYSGKLIPALDYVKTYPAAGLDILQYSALAAFGQCVILYGVYRFNPMTITIITTLRKFVSVLGSVFFFGHNLAPLQWCAIAVVFLAIVSDTWHKHHEKQAQKVKAH
jgi:UDP-galactose transporter B1